jgi:hypothetical protein
MSIDINLKCSICGNPKHPGACGGGGGGKEEEKKQDHDNKDDKKSISKKTQEPIDDNQGHRNSPFKSPFKTRPY